MPNTVAEGAESRTGVSVFLLGRKENSPKGEFFCIFKSDVQIDPPSVSGR